ncbi:uncharacterized protein LOC128920545 [Zeugodacus cucurbitae]|uniref:uncharacterized protein LOC128920545 n=1 Tax=Zeugodacus cucurbitae TaxID=28588 RepID=UPI0023D90EE0|nr:uncharacterized protein LOC128920545 [Zeugodacus cucurbitae]
MSEELIPSTELSLFAEQCPLGDESPTTENVDNESVVILDSDEQLINLLCSWDLSSNALIQFNRCGLKSVAILQMIHSHDTDEIFNARELIADKIKFRYSLQKWRLENNFDMLTCCSGDRTITNLSSIRSWLSSASTPSTSPNNEPNVEEVLKETVAGNDIIKKYENCGCLQESDQSAIVRIIVDKLNLTYYDAMLGALDANCRHYYLINLLHAVITPPRVNKNIKPSITDAQMDMMVHLININNFQQKLDELNESAHNEGLTLQPRVFVVGESPQNLKKFYVCVDNIKYKVGSLIRAIDLVVKMFFVFNIEYSVKSKYVWIFLQRYIYDISSKEKFPKIENILNKLNNVQ